MRRSRWLGAGSILVLGAWNAVSALAAQPEQRILLDAPGPSRLELRAYRRCDGPLVAKNGGRAPSREGLDDFRLSGSAQFSKAGWEDLRARLAGFQAVVVDLREEPHGFVTGGLPVSWREAAGSPGVPQPKSSDQVLAGEKVLVASLVDKGRQAIGTLDGRGKPLSVEVREAWTEEAMVTPAGFLYRRFPVSGQGPPDDSVVDAFLDLARALPKGTWYHFHCDDGGARTTLFMAMMDMLANARKVSLEDLLARQRLFGGADLQGGKTPEAKARTSFLRTFYDYARASGEGASRSWSDWKKTQSGR